MVGSGEDSPVMRQLSKAREAFENMDPEASKTAHETKVLQEGGHGENASISVKTALDCVAHSLLAVTSFIIFISTFPLPVRVHLALGIAVALAVATSSTFSTAMNSRTYRQRYMVEKRREAWELRNYPQGEIEEMVELYRSRGMGKTDATSVIETMAKYESFFVDVMMVEELGLLPPAEWSFASSAMITFASSCVGGLWPLLGFALSPHVLESDSKWLAWTMLLSLLGILILSVYQSRFNIGKKWYVVCSEMLLVFAAAAGLCNFAGSLLSLYLLPKAALLV